MGLFDFGNGKKTETTTVNEKTTEVRKLAGFDNITEVKEAAQRSSVASDAGSASVAGASASRQPKRRLTAEQEKLLEKEERKKRAMERVGMHLSKKLATIPYEVWAKLAREDKLKLNAEEAEGLAGDYFELAQSLEIDFDSPMWLGVGIFLSNAVLIGERADFLSTKTKHEIGVEDFNKEPLQ
jgi:hypothetical protein